MVSITLRYTRPGLSAPTYLARPAQPAGAAGPRPSAQPVVYPTRRKKACIKSAEDNVGSITGSCNSALH